MKYSKNSLQVMAGLHPDLQTILTCYINHARVDISLLRGIRTYEKQLKYFLEGNSKLDPRKDSHLKNAKHLRFPAYAVDLGAYGWYKDPKTGINKHLNTYDNNSLCYIAGDICRFADSLYGKQMISHRLRWGGNWDLDGIVMADQTFQDLCHFELVDNDHETYRQMNKQFGYKEAPKHNSVRAGEEGIIEIKFDK